MTRRERREHTFCVLFSREFHETGEGEEQVSRYFSGLTDLSEEELEERDLARVPKMTEEERASMEERIRDISCKVFELDERINEVSEGWKTSRMSRVDLTLIRLALYEMRYDDTVPVKVAINEAVEISKKYGGPDSRSFVNGILAKLVDG
ncbi:MAG: transcription antitermination factor NusB [Lachnospiraceae bacterium]|nr:transcription antitermination factor NusB [Lachnospiraceae bacterium]